MRSLGKMKMDTRMNENDPADGLRNLEQLNLPDTRMRFLAVREGG